MRAAYIRVESFALQILYRKKRIKTVETCWHSLRKWGEPVALTHPPPTLIAVGEMKAACIQMKSDAAANMRAKKVETCWRSLKRLDARPPLATMKPKQK